MKRCNFLPTFTAACLVLVTLSSTTFAQMIVLWAGEKAPNGWYFCDGTKLPKANHATLFEAVGTRYGNSGDKFALPDLEKSDEPSLGSKTKVRYIISDRYLETTYRDLPVGHVFLFAGDFAMRNFEFAEGQRLYKTEYPALFEVLRSRFAIHSGSEELRLPDLRYNLPVNAQTPLDVQVSRTLRRHPSPVISVMRTLTPERSKLRSMEPYLAQVVVYSGSKPPPGWAACNGQLLRIAENTALFSLIGTKYGGDGRTTLGLPNMTEKDKTLKTAAGLKESSDALFHMIALAGAYPSRPELVTAVEQGDQPGRIHRIDINATHPKTYHPRIGDTVQCYMDFPIVPEQIVEDLRITIEGISVSFVSVVSTSQPKIIGTGQISTFLIPRRIGLSEITIRPVIPGQETRAVRIKFVVEEKRNF